MALCCCGSGAATSKRLGAAAAWPAGGTRCAAGGWRCCSALSATWRASSGVSPSDEKVVEAGVASLFVMVLLRVGVYSESKRESTGPECTGRCCACCCGFCCSWRACTSCRAAVPYPADADVKDTSACPIAEAPACAPLDDEEISPAA